MPLIKLLYRGLCPNCGGDITAERLAKGLPCEVCLAEEPKVDDPIAIAQELGKRGTLKLNYYYIYKLEKDFNDFAKYFEDKYGFALSSAQRSWARRLLSYWRESFSIVAPTGVGKTTLLMAYVAYLAERRKVRSLYLVPTENLVAQTGERLSQLTDGDSVAYYYSSLRESDRQAALERIKSGQFLVAVVTPGFLVRNFEMLSAYAPYELIVVDDVDSLLRNSKNIDRVLKLMGFSDRALQLGYEVVKLSLDLARVLASGDSRKADGLMKELQERRVELQAVKGSTQGQLVIASATGRPRGVKHLIFRELLGFEVGSGTDYLRNVVDSYVITSDVVNEVVKLAKRLGPGGLLFVSQAYGRPMVKVVAKALQDGGVKAVTALSSPTRAVKALTSGEADVAVGMASRYGALVRGIDLPTVVKYAIFVGVPAIKLELRVALLSPQRLLRALMFAETKDQAFRDYRERLEKLLKGLGAASSQLLAAAVRGSIETHGALKELRELVLEASAKVADFLESTLQEDGSSLRIGTMVLRREGSVVYLYSPDQASYIQASGRTSRLFNGAMTKGLSVIVDQSQDLVDALQDRLRWTSQALLIPLDSVDLNSVMKDVEETRNPVSAARRRVDVVTELIIVESPTKAKAIANFWGRPAKRREGRLILYETTTVDPQTNTVHLITVTASKGHIFDLAEDLASKGYLFGVRLTGSGFEPVYTSIKRCLSCGYQFTQDTNVCPRCGSTSILDSRINVDALRKVAMEVDRVIVMTDPDREGEKIAWDIYMALRPYNRNIYRSAFHEVTLRAFMEALRNLGNFNENMVMAQVVRRIDDRWIGFITSQWLWATVNMRWLGAGRVQTPVLGWIVDRYNNYRKGMGFKVRALLPSGTQIVLYTIDAAAFEEARSLIAVTNEGKEVATLKAVTKKIWTEDANPLPPYTTDEMIFDASAKLNFPAELTMKLAQDLFYSGLITYHRTDSTRVSDVGIDVARQYLETHGMAQYFKPRSWGAGGAHEAIRPTRPLNVEELQEAILDGSIKVPTQLTLLHFKLYQLIFERFMASQMAPATLERALVTLSLGPLSQDVEVVTSVVKEGFTLMLRPRIEGWVSRELGKEYEVGPVEVKTFKGSLVQLYKSGDVVMLMKRKNIGRPSTYAKIIDSIKRHGYVIESKRLRFLVPTSRGVKVYGLLMDSPFAPLLTEDESRRLEETLDKIEQGQLDPAETVAHIRDEIVNRARTAGFRLEV